MMKAAKDRYLGNEIVFEFLVELVHVDGLDGHGSFLLLQSGVILADVL